MVFSPHKINYIAEISCNHEGDINLMYDHIHAAHTAGATAVKFQLYEPDDLLMPEDHTLPHLTDIRYSKWGACDLRELYTRTQTPYEWLPLIHKFADAHNIPIFCSVFSAKGVDKLKYYTMTSSFKPAALKIASLEIDNMQLINSLSRCFAGVDIPVFISTGAADINKLDAAIAALNRRQYSGAGMRPMNVIPLYCVSSYPTKIEDANMLKLSKWQKVFDRYTWGVSDHGISTITPIMAVTLGAKYIERHFVLDREKSKSVDAPWSVTPLEFSNMIKDCDDVYMALGGPDIHIRTAPTTDIKLGLFISKDIYAGAKIIDEDVRYGRYTNDELFKSYLIPSMPINYNLAVGKVATRHIKAGTPLSWKDIE